MYAKLDQKSEQNSHVKRISISLPPQLLSEFNTSMRKAGFSDRSKAIQTALHSFIDQYEWQKSDMQYGAGTINMLYGNLVCSTIVIAFFHLLLSNASKQV